MNLKDGEHHTPIHVASQAGHVDCVSLLTQGRLGPHLEEATIYQVKEHPFARAWPRTLPCTSPATAASWMWWWCCWAGALLHQSLVLVDILVKC